MDRHGCMGITVCERPKDFVPAGHPRTTPDLLAVPTVPGHETPNLPTNMNGQQPVQWLTVQAERTAGTPHEVVDV